MKPVSCPDFSHFFNVGSKIASIFSPWRSTQENMRSVAKKLTVQCFELKILMKKVKYHEKTLRLMRPKKKLFLFYCLFQNHYTDNKMRMNLLLLTIQSSVNANLMMENHALKFEHTKAVIDFIMNYAECNAIILPGRTPGHWKTDI